MKSLHRSALFLLVAAPLQAQSLWRPRTDTTSFGISLSDGFYKHADDIRFPTFAVTLDARLPVTRRLAVAIELPYAYVTYHTSPSFFDSSSTTLVRGAVGNPWLGIEGTINSMFSWTAGFRPAVASSSEDELNAEIIGLFNDFEHIEAYAPRSTTFRAMLRAGTMPASGRFIEGSIGATTIKQRDEDRVTLADYAFRGGVRGTKYMAALQLAGRYKLSGDESFDERLINEVMLSVEGTRGRVRPMVGIKSYLDSDQRKTVSAVLVFGARVSQ